jgi:hypothetical protein
LALNLEHQYTRFLENRSSSGFFHCYLVIWREDQERCWWRIDFPSSKGHGMTAQEKPTLGHTPPASLLVLSESMVPEEEMLSALRFIQDSGCFR